ncbi:hypothetical protein MASR2M78_34550 [Treponema sp.]
MKRIGFFMIFCLVGLYISAQSNEFVDTLLSETAVDYGQISYLVLVASDNLSEDSDPARAFELLENLGWASKTAKLESLVDISEYAFILMRAFGMKGGVMYSLFPSPRYAYREFVARQIIQGRSDPDMKVDGVAAVRMLGRVFDEQE